MNKEPFKNKAYLTIWHKPQTTGIIASHGKGCSRTAPLFDLFGEGFYLFVAILPLPVTAGRCRMTP